MSPSLPRIALLASCLLLAASSARADKVLVYRSGAPEAYTDTLMTELIYLEISSSGAWVRIERKPGTRATTTTESEGTLEPAAIRDLVAAAERVAAKPGPARPAAAGRTASVVALFGFGKGALYLAAGSAAFAPLQRLLAAAPARFQARPGARRKISSSAYTMVGEGASSSFTLDDRGNFEDRSGGDIGSGYDAFSARRRSIDEKKAAELFERLARLVPAKGSGPEEQRGLEGQSMTFTGFGGQPVTTSDRAVIRAVQALIGPALTSRPPAPWVGQVQYSAQVRAGFEKAYSPSTNRYVKSPRYRSFRGELDASGRSMQQEPSETQGRVTQVDAGKVQAIFSALQAIVDRARGAKAIAGRAERAILGASSIAVGFLDPRATTFSLDVADRQQAFAEAKALLDQVLLGVR